MSSEKYKYLPELNTLLSMGFSVEASTKALDISNGNIYDAAKILKFNNNLIDLKTANKKINYNKNNNIGNPTNFLANDETKDMAISKFHPDIAQEDIFALDEDIIFGIITSYNANTLRGFIALAYAPKDFFYKKKIIADKQFLFYHGIKYLKKNKIYNENLEVFLGEGDIVLFKPTAKDRTKENKGFDLYANEIILYRSNKLHQLSKKNNEVIEIQNNSKNTITIPLILSSLSSKLFDFSDEYGIFDFQLENLKNKTLYGIVYKNSNNEYCNLILYHKTYLSVYIPNQCIGPYKIGDVVQFKTPYILLTNNYYLDTNIHAYVVPTITFSNFEKMQIENRQLESNNCLSVFKTFYGLKPFYISGEQLPLKESNIVEFKLHTTLKLNVNSHPYEKSNFATLVDKYINSFLNGNNDAYRYSVHNNRLISNKVGYVNQNKHNLETIGGLLLFGVADSGIVAGVEVNEKHHDDVKKFVSNLLILCEPPINKDMYHITFIPVIDIYPTSYITQKKNKNNIIESLKEKHLNEKHENDQVKLKPSRYIICIQVVRGNKFLYTTSGRTSFDKIQISGMPTVTDGNKGPRRARFVRLGDYVKELHTDNVIYTKEKTIVPERLNQQQYDEDLKKQVIIEVNKILYGYCSTKDNFDMSTDEKKITNNINYENALELKDHNTIYKYAQLVEQNNKNNAIKYYKIAADLGNYKAILRYALLIFKTNKDEATKYYKIAADMNIIDAMVFYANSIEDSNKKEAIEYYKKAIKLGDSNAMRFYADLIYAKNKEKATKYYKMAAGLNNYEISNNYDTLIKEAETNKDIQNAIYKYANFVMENNKIEAIKYFKICANLGDKRAITMYHKLIKEL